MKVFFRFTWCILLFGLAVFPTQAAFTSIYIFGDGVSTTTNNTYAGPLYYGKRFSNGRVWIEVLAQQQGLGANSITNVNWSYSSNNWSYFGDNSGNLVQNVNNFTAPTNATNALFVVWVNDADFVYDITHYTPYTSNNIAAWTNAINQSLTNHYRAITNLYAKGVRTLVMPNAVDITEVPAYNIMAADNKSFIRQRVIDFNTAFTTTLNQARTNCPGLKIYEPDFFTLLNNVLTNATAYGLTNALLNGLSIDALDDPSLSDLSLNGPGANYIFWDDMDPTAKFHEVMADTAQQLISPVMITSQPTNRTVVVGGTATFSVTAGGTPPLSYQWNFNGTNISGATNTTLVFTNVQFSQAGTYTVLVTNLFGSVLSSNAVLTVNGIPPFITTQPTNQTVTVGGTATFSVTAGGTPSPGYRWNFNGTNISGATNTTLVFTNVQFSQAGTYTVLVTNLFGSVLSSNAVLTVNGIPPFITTQPTNQTVVVGGTASFSVTASGTPSPGYQWNFNGTNISGATNTTLVFTNVQFSQAGTYTVLVTNLFGSVLSSNAVLTVNGIPPFITTQPTNQTVVVGGTATFSVTAGGTPSPGYQWNFNGTNISGATNTTLVFTNVQFSQAGTYTVLVTNLFGSVLSSNAVLTANGIPPFITTQPTNQTVVVGGTATFSVTAGGTPSLSYQWYFNSTPLTGATNTTLTLTNVKLWDAGIYTVTVSNIVGSVSSFYAVLRVWVPSSIVVWGDNSYGQTNVPSGLTNAVAIAGGDEHILALKSDGTVAAWGWDAYGECDVPSGLTNVVAVAAGVAADHSLALKGDGTVVAWGLDFAGQADVPSGLTNAVAIAAGWYHSMALKGDGTVVAWGGNPYGQMNIPSSLASVMAIAAGYAHCLALNGNGTVVAWGENNFGQCNVPSGLTNVVAVAAGWYHSLALKRDGTVVAWGWNGYGQCNVPSGLTNVVAIAGGGGHSLALKGDGTMVIWGVNGKLDAGQSIVPTSLTNVVAISGGTYDSMALSYAPPAVPRMIITQQPLSQEVLEGNTMTGTSNTFRLSWNAVTGLVYQVQYKTNLLQPNWINLGVAITATNAITTAVPDVIGTDPQRFYRIQQVPAY